MKTENKDLARAMRHELTWAEKSLWRELKNRKLAGLKFRRQQPFGTYILDFYCSDLKMVVELDGGQHDHPETRDYDLARTRFLEEEGLKVLRFWNSQVRENLPWVLESIRREVEGSETPHPNPLPQGAREQRKFSLSLEGRGLG
jgi:very-short-patch-repair endonuclease